MFTCCTACVWLFTVVQLRTEYIGVMARVLSGHFKTYLAALEKMEAAVAGEAGTKARGGAHWTTHKD
jgi:hypothetical protein